MKHEGVNLDLTYLMTQTRLKFGRPYTDMYVYTFHLLSHYLQTNIRNDIRQLTIKTN